MSGSVKSSTNHKKCSDLGIAHTCESFWGGTNDIHDNYDFETLLNGKCSTYATFKS